MSAVPFVFAAPIPVGQPIPWSQTDPKATWTYDYPAGKCTVTLPAGLVPNDATTFMGNPWISPASMTNLRALPAYVEAGGLVDVSLHIEFDMPDIGGPCDVGLGLYTFDGDFQPNPTSSQAGTVAQVDARVGAQSSHLYMMGSALAGTTANNKGMQNVTAGHHVWDVAFRVKMDAFRASLTFDVSLTAAWGATPYAALAAQKEVVTTVTATITSGAYTGGGGAPADVFYRDPADQKFKPLTTLMVNGFPATGGLDPATAKIKWAPAPEVLHVRPDPVAVAPQGMTLIPGATVTAVPDGLRLDVPAYTVPAGTPSGIRGLFHIDPPVPVPAPTDDRTYRVVMDLHVENGPPGTAVPQVMLLLSSGLASTYVTLKTGPYSAPNSAARAYERLWAEFANGAELAFYLTTAGVATWMADPAPTIGLSLSANPILGPIDVAHMTLTLTNLRLECLSVAAP